MGSIPKQLFAESGVELTDEQRNATKNNRPMKEQHTYARRDEIVEIENTIKSVPGFGDLGTYRGIYNIEDTDLTVGYGYQQCGCEYCGYDRVIIEEQVNPEFPVELEYECANPECKWTKSEEFSDEFVDSWL